MKKTSSILLAAALLLPCSALAQVKISQLPAASTASGTDVTVLVQAGVTKQISVGNLGASLSLSAAQIDLGNGTLMVGGTGNTAGGIAPSGDLSMSNAGVFTLDTVNSTSGTFDIGLSGTFVVNGKGLVTQFVAPTDLVLTDGTNVLGGTYYVTGTLTGSGGGVINAQQLGGLAQSSYLTAAVTTGTVGHITLSSSITSGTIHIGISGSTTPTDIGLGNVVNAPIATGTLAIGNGSLTWNAAGQVTAFSTPTNIFLTTGTLPGAQVSGTVAVASVAIASASGTFTIGTLSLVQSGSNLILPGGLNLNSGSAPSAASYTTSGAVLTATNAISMSALTGRNWFILPDSISCMGSGTGTTGSSASNYFPPGFTATPGANYEEKNAPGTSYGEDLLAMPAMGGTASVYSTAGAGRQFADVDINYWNELHPCSPLVTGIPRGIINQGCNNDLSAYTAAQIEATMVDFINKAHADQYWPIVFGTTLPDSNGTMGDTFEVNRLLVNAWLLSGSSGADLVVDTADYPGLVATGSTGSGTGAAWVLNGTYYNNDGTHPTAAGNVLLATAFYNGGLPLLSIQPKVTGSAAWNSWVAQGLETSPWCHWSIPFSAWNVSSGSGGAGAASEDGGYSYYINNGTSAGSNISLYSPSLPLGGYQAWNSSGTSARSYNQFDFGKPGSAAFEIYGTSGFGGGIIPTTTTWSFTISNKGSPATTGTLTSGKYGMGIELAGTGTDDTLNVTAVAANGSTGFQSAVFADIGGNSTTHNLMFVWDGYGDMQAYVDGISSGTFIGVAPKQTLQPALFYIDTYSGTDGSLRFLNFHIPVVDMRRSF